MDRNGVMRDIVMVGLGVIRQVTSPTFPHTPRTFDKCKTARLRFTPPTHAQVLGMRPEVRPR